VFFLSISFNFRLKLNDQLKLGGFDNLVKIWILTCTDDYICTFPHYQYNLSTWFYSFWSIHFDSCEVPSDSKSFNTMDKLRLLLLILLLGVFAGCTKDSVDLPDCTKATVRFNNLSINPYNVYVDGTFRAKLDGNKYKDFELSAGDHVAKVEQVSGYLLFPTVYNWNFTLVGCNDISYSFP
jgi:hypothetical protein